MHTMIYILHEGDEMERNFKNAEYNSGWRLISKNPDIEKIELNFNDKLDNISEQIEKLKKQIENVEVNEDNKLKSLRSDFENHFNNIVIKQKKFESNITKANGQMAPDFETWPDMEPPKLKNIDEIETNIEDYMYQINNQLCSIIEILRVLRDTSSKQTNKSNSIFSNIFKNNRQ